MFMGELLNFREFYQKPPIVIGEKDLDAVNDMDYTHWLIALEGCMCDGDFPSWKVVVFPTFVSGYFDFETPYYSSTFFGTFNEAHKLSLELENMAKLDQLATYNK
jgi:hypothetical protein